MSRYQRYVDGRMKDATLDMKDGRQLTVVSVGDYEPADPSVGISSGYVCVTCDDGKDYDVSDNGDVYAAGSNGDRLGTGPEPMPAWDCD